MEVIPTKKTFNQFLFFWMGQLFSLLGSMVVHFTIIWWLQLETGSPTVLSLGQFFYFLPMLLFLPIAGVLSDKLKRKNIILVVDSLQAYATLILIIFFIFDVTSIWLIFLFIALRSIFQAFHLPAVASITPTMVPKDKISRINSVNFIFISLIQLIGPALGALLWQFFTIDQILWVDIITFLIALIPLIIIKIPFVRDHSDQKKKNGFIKDLKIGFVALIAVPGLVILLIMSIFVNFLTQPLGTLMPYYVNTIHGGSEFEYALVLIFLNGGMIGGALIASFKKDWKHKIPIMFYSIAFAGIGYGILALIPRGLFIFIGITLLTVGLVVPFINILYSTILQTQVPQDKLGRVISIDGTLSMIISPLGSVIAGPIAELIGIQPLFLFCAILMIIFILSLYFFTGIRHIDYSIQIESKVLEVIE